MVNSPADLKQLNREQLIQLADVHALERRARQCADRRRLALQRFSAATRRDNDLLNAAH